jgi:cation diffusion facilitator CzcD-associated flavoprotein CzcO
MRDRDLGVAIVGGGFGGVGAAIAMRRLGVRDLALFERGERLGGVWQHNTYPGAACDVPSNLYSYSFARNPRWTRRFSEGGEIRRYLEGCADAFGVRDAVRTGVDVISATWDDARALWHLKTSAGEHEARVLICACGQLTTPNIPAIDGIEDFAGPVFHSARWRHDIDLTGTRVAVVGTGASAIQFVPAIAPSVRALHVFQRSAPWILPKPDRAYRAWESRLFERVPAAQLADRLGLWAFFEAAVPGFTTHPGLLAPLRALNAAFLRRQVADPELRERLRPRDAIGCKRTLVSNGWYPVFARGDAELVTERVVRATDTALVDAAGIAREVDVVIYGTGFRANDFVAPLAVAGRGGHTLAEVWDPAPQAYLGTSVSGFPNLFLLYGPNTNMGSGSAIYLIESQLRHVSAAVTLLQRTGARALEVRPEVLAAFNAELRERLARSVWESGCSNWYVDEHGRDTSNWPGTMTEFRRRAARVDLGAYALELTPRAAATA